jgi:hypothetical protein
MDESLYTLEEIGQYFGVSRERIREIEAKALLTLRHPRRSRDLQAFHDEDVEPWHYCCQDHDCYRTRPASTSPVNAQYRMNKTTGLLDY